MKKFKVLGLIMCLCVMVQLCGYAKSNTAQDDDIIIPAVGVSLDENGQPSTWVSMPKNPHPATSAKPAKPAKSAKPAETGTSYPVQKGNRLFVGPANGVGSYTNDYSEDDTTTRQSKPKFTKPEGFSFHLQQPTIQVGR